MTEDKNLNIQNYKILNEIGKGHFGKVYKVLNTINKNIYAIKTIKLDNIIENELDKIKKEAKILLKLKNHHIVKCYDYFVYNNTFNIIMEYCDNLDLRKFIDEHKRTKTPINQKVIYYIIYDICLGLLEIHNNNIIHRDLKPENLFFDKDYTIKIGDFGICKELTNNNRYADTYNIGTLNYMSPEMIIGRNYNNKVDIWALGCIIYELCSLQYCFEGKTPFLLCNKIVKEKHGIINDKLYNNKIQNLIDSLLQKDYKNRPNINEVYNTISNLKINNDLNQNDYINLDSISKIILNREEKKNEIKLLIKIEEDDLDKYIFLYNFKVINESNSQLYNEDNKQIEMKNSYRFSKKGIYHFTIKIKKEITDCSKMFFSCKNIFKINISLFNTKNVTNMEEMFYCCEKLNSINFGSSFYTQEVSNMSSLFYNCKNLRTLNLSSFNTEKVNNMKEMFYHCEKLVSINFSSSFNTQNVLNMSRMFYNCKNLKNLDLSFFNTKNVTNMSEMFYYCENLIKMFYHCHKLKSVNLSSFNTKNVINMRKMFSFCFDLINMDLSTFNTENVIDMSNMFYKCENLISIDLSSFNMENVSNMSDMFFDCNQLKNISFPNSINIDKMVKMNNIFYNCENLKDNFLLPYNSFENINFVEIYNAFSASSKGVNEIINFSNNIILPLSTLIQLDKVYFNNNDNDYPIFFKISNYIFDFYFTHCGVFEFTAKEGECYIPDNMFKSLNLIEGQKVILRHKILEKGNYIQIRPNSEDFFNFIKDLSFENILEDNMRNYFCITEGDRIAISYKNKRYDLDIVKCCPCESIMTINSNIYYDVVKYNNNFIENNKKKIKIIFNCKEKIFKKLTKEEIFNNKFKGHHVRADGTEVTLEQDEKKNK